MYIPPVEPGKCNTTARARSGSVLVIHYGLDIKIGNVLTCRWAWISVRSLLAHRAELVKSVEG